MSKLFGILDGIISSDFAEATLQSLDAINAEAGGATATLITPMSAWLAGAS